MAFNKSPSTWLGAGYGLAANKVTLTTATAGSNVLLTKLTDAEADPSSGDVRDVLWAICYAFYAKWDAVIPGNRPSKMKLVKTVQANADNVTQTETYTFVFTTTTDPSNVTAE